MIGMVALAAAAAAQPTVQQQFEAAVAAFARGDNQAALDGFRAVGARAVSPRSRAIAELRAGLALHALDRREEATSALRHALAALPPGDATLAADRLEAALALGAIDELSLDHAAARADYGAALAAATQPIDKVRARLGMARVTMFADPDRAIALMDEALALVAAMPDVTKAQRGQVRTLRGRALLNAGRPREALVELRASVAELGGLGLRVDRADLLARSDLAIAALRAGQGDDAKQYLAYSGAGTLDSDLARGADMDPPACGDGGLKPDDVGVVQFGIADDGHVVYPELIYSSVRGDGGLLFARAATGWSWRADAVKPIPALFRSVLRVELRCTTTLPRPGTEDYLETAARRWAEGKGAEPAPDDAASAAERLPALRAELARREAAGGDPVRQVPVLLALADSPLTTREETAGWIARALAAARAGDAPPLAQAALLVRAVDTAPGRDRAAGSARAAELRRIADDPAVRRDPRAVAAVELLVAERLARAGQRAAALPFLQAVQDQRGLEPHDPLREAALARLASLQAAGGQLDRARETFAQSGLTGEQCALVDVEPLRVRGWIGSEDYPKEALRWGIGGWAISEYDIRADGAPADVRTLVAYPPFVFGPPTERFIRGSRYTQTFRPDGRLGCGGQRQVVQFRKP